jgi:hypothetical protein
MTFRIPECQDGSQSVNYPGQAGAIKDQSQKHEMTKARKGAKKIFVFFRQRRMFS